MPKIPKPLTDTKIKSAKPKEKEYNLSDGNGLFLRVMPNGKKRFLFNYIKPLTKSRTNIGFGCYPEITLAQARQKRQEARSLLAQKLDPKEHYSKQESELLEALTNTFGVYALKWKELKLKQVKQETIEKQYRSLEKHILELIKDDCDK
ncbi:integrase arm-type DNA-binding domain-containing protein [Thalassotalea fusca]